MNSLGQPSTPLAKVLVGAVSPTLLAGLFYLKNDDAHIVMCKRTNVINELYSAPGRSCPPRLTP